MSQGHRHSVGRLNQPFVGIPTFLRSNLCGDLDKLDADVAIMGVPTDEGSPYLAGSRFGPRAIREQSLRFGADGRGYYDAQARRRFLEYEMTRAGWRTWGTWTSCPPTSSTPSITSPA